MPRQEQARPQRQRQRGKPSSPNVIDDREYAEREAVMVAQQAVPRNRRQIAVYTLLIQTWVMNDAYGSSSVGGISSGDRSSGADSGSITPPSIIVVKPGKLVRLIVVTGIAVCTRKSIDRPEA